MNGVFQYWAEIVIAIGTITGGLIAAFKYLILKPLIHLIDERTKEIQPGANGGWSLSDVHRRIDKIESRFDSLEAKLEKPARKTKTPPQ